MESLTEPRADVLPYHPRATKRTDLAVLNAWRLALATNAPAYVIVVVGRAHEWGGYLRFYVWTLDATLAGRDADLRAWLPRLYRGLNRFTIETARVDAIIQRPFTFARAGND